MASPYITGDSKGDGNTLSKTLSVTEWSLANCPLSDVLCTVKGMFSISFLKTVPTMVCQKSRSIIVLEIWLFQIKTHTSPHIHIYIYNIYIHTYSYILYTHSIGFMWARWYYGHSLKKLAMEEVCSPWFPMIWQPSVHRQRWVYFHTSSNQGIWARTTCAAKPEAYPREQRKVWRVHSPALGKSANTGG